jgi:hypothetical protein
MILWLKEQADLYNTWTVAQINVIPTGVQGVAIVSGILATSLCMIYPIWAVIIPVATVLTTANVLLLVWEIPVGLHCKSQSIGALGSFHRAVADMVLSCCILHARPDILRHTNSLPVGEPHNEG